MGACELLGVLQRAESVRRYYTGSSSIRVMRDFGGVLYSGSHMQWGAMNLSQWFQTPLQLGEWSAARHAFHLLYYEQTIALPSMRQWLGGPMSFLRGPDDEAAWG